jgi:hypothetical protein
MDGKLHEIYGYHSGVDEDLSHFRRYAMSTGKHLLIFWDSIIPLKS